MPTTAEVEARLRRTATACEPMVEDLLRDDAPAPVPVAAVRSRRAGWLAAVAAVLVVLAVAGVAVVRDGDADGGVAAGGGTVPAPPGEGLLLPDGSRVAVTVPGPRDWRPAGASASFTADGWAEPRSIQLEPGTTADLPRDPEVVRTYGPGRTLVRDRLTTHIVVAQHGWVGSVMVATTHDEDVDLPAAVVDALARDLTFSVTPEGPVAVEGPGLRPLGATRFLRPASGGDDEIGVVRTGGRPVEACTQGFLPPLWTCSADGTVLVMVMTEAAEGERLTPLIEVTSPDEATATTTTTSSPTTTSTTTPADPTVDVPVALAEGTEAVLTLPGTDAWAPTHAVAFLRIEGVPDGAVRPQASLFPETPEATAARDGSRLEPLGGDVHMLTNPTGLRALLVAGDGWTAAFPLDITGAAVPDAVIDRLIGSIVLEATAAGPVRLTGDGLEVTSAVTALASAAAAPPTGSDRDVLWVAVEPEPCTDTGVERCVDGRLRITATGPTSEAALPALTGVVSGGG